MEKTMNAARGRARVLVGSVSLFALVVSGAHAQTLDLRRYQTVDLTHPLNAKTIYWPTSPTTFKLDSLAYGQTPGGWFYSAFAFSAPEHGGTHLDAPIHFGEGHLTVDRVPLDRLIAPAVVIDVSSRARGEQDYRLTPDDILAFEKANGRIQPGTIVLLRTGWSTRWPDKKSYLGDDTPNDATKLHFPSYGVEAARFLIQERRAAAIGVDAASIDVGASQDFMVHRIAAAADVPGIENLTNLNLLPPTGALVFALPMKIEGGSGGPARVVALVPRR
jgi:kynurenine formamidase